MSHLCQRSTVCCQTLVQRNCVPLGVLPVGNARRNFPRLLVFHRHLPRWRVHDGHRRRRRACGDFFVFELGRLQGVCRHLHHSNDALLSCRLSERTLTWSVLRGKAHANTGTTTSTPTLRMLRCCRHQASITSTTTNVTSEHECDCADVTRLATPGCTCPLPPRLTRCQE